MSRAVIQGPKPIRMHPLSQGIRSVLGAMRRTAILERQMVEQTARVQVERDTVQVVAGVTVG